MFPVAVFVCAVAIGGPPQQPASQNSSAPPAETVDLFAAIDHGQVEATFIAHDARQARLQLLNKTDKPLHIVLPEAFAAVPVLAQIDPNARQNRQAANKVPQTLGTGVQGQNIPGLPNIQMPNINRNQAMRGLMNIEPEKVGQIKLRTVCLEYGKPSPTAHVPYQIKPLAEVTTKPGVFELCARLGDRDISQGSIQAAAWHLANDMSWERLGKFSSAGIVMNHNELFSSRELQEAKRLADDAVSQAEKHRKSNAAPGSSGA
jgi:hypothetical protein